MQNWQKDRNYRKFENADGSFTYVIMVDGETVEVSAEVYKAYSQSDRRERYCAERDAGRLRSIEWFEARGISLERLLNRHIESAEDTVVQSISAGQIRDSFMALKPDDQRLIHALVIEGMTEREYSVIIGLSQKGVNKRKHKAFENLKKLILALQG